MTKFLLLTSVACLAVSTAAHAQVAAPADAASATGAAATGADAAAQDEGLAEIVVTAQRRTENLQDVPISITAANAEALATARVENIANVQAISPSVTFRTSNNATASANVIIRGLGTTGNSRSFEGAVGVFVDGVYRTRAAAALQNFLDIDNLQILRGPQGTLFGKNTTAGAIMLTSTAPSLTEVEGFGSVSYGNYDHLITRAAVSLPVSDRAAFRIAGLYSDFDGYYKDVNAGGHLNGNETAGVKAQLALEPTDALRVRVIGDYSRGTGDCCYGTVDYINGPTQPLINALTLAAGNRLASNDFRDYQASLSSPGRQVIKDYGGTLLIDLEVGDDTLKSVTGYRRFSTIQTGADADFSGADVILLDEAFRSRFYSQELSYNGKVSALNADYVLGAFFSDERLRMGRELSWGAQAQTYWDRLFAARGVPAGTVLAAPGVYQGEALGGGAKSYAAFAHVNFEIGEQWNLIAGARYSIERKTGFFRYNLFRPEPNVVTRILGTGPAPAYSDKTTDRALSGTLGVQYRPVDDVMLYATYNRGFKAGGVNMDVNAAGLRANNPAEVPGGVPRSPVYEPETVNAYEIGAKMQYLERRARTNVSLFYYDIADIQVAQFLGLQFAILNARSAKDYGVEVENLFQLTPSLTLGLDGTYLPKAKFGADPTLAAVLADRRFRYAPKFQGNATLSLDQPVTDDLNVTGRLQYQYSGAQYLSNATLARRGGVSIVNANLGLRAEDERWSIEGFVQNLFDKIYANYTFATPLQAGDQNAYLAAPRTYGVLVRTRF